MADNVININKKDYKVDDLDNKSKYIVAQIRDLEGKVASAKFQLDQHDVNIFSWQPSFHLPRW